MTWTCKGPEGPVSAIAWAIDSDISGYINTINTQKTDLTVEKHRQLVIGHRVDEPQSLPLLVVRMSDDADFISEGALYAIGNYQVIATYYISDNDPYALWKKRARTQRAIMEAVYNNTSLPSAYPAHSLGYLSVPQVPAGVGEGEQGAWLGMTSVVFQVLQDE